MILATAHTERKVSLDFLDLRVYLVVPVTQGSATLEHPVSEENQESLEYTVYPVSPVYQDQEVSEASARPACVCLCVFVCVFEQGRVITASTQKCLNFRFPFVNHFLKSE